VGRFSGRITGRITGGRISGRAATGQPLLVGGLRLRDVRPLHAGRTTALTKAGRLSLRATADDGAPVKLTEMHSPAHAGLVATLARTTLRDVLPAIVTVSGSTVVSAWQPVLPGASPVTAAELGGLLARLHATPVPDAPTGFDYVDDYLVPRARRAAATLAAEARLDHALDVASAALHDVRRCVTHPDLTPDNVLRTVDGGLVVIDNELLGVGRAPSLDVCNLTRSLERADRSSAVEAHGSAGGERIADAMLVGLRALWLIRMVGSLHVAGRLADAARMLEDGPESLPLPFEASHR